MISALKKAPEDRVARLEKARVLTYLERGSEALEILNRLRMEQPGDPGVRVAAVEAYLSMPGFSQGPGPGPEGTGTLARPEPGGRALLARCYAHSPEPAPPVQGRGSTHRESLEKPLPPGLPPHFGLHFTPAASI